MSDEEWVNISHNRLQEMRREAYTMLLVASVALFYAGADWLSYWVAVGFGALGVLMFVRWLTSTEAKSHG